MSTRDIHYHDTVKFRKIVNFRLLLIVQKCNISNLCKKKKLELTYTSLGGVALVVGHL